MASTSTPRHELPYLVVGQAQKEITHNEALVRIDALLEPLIEAEVSTLPAVQSGAQAGKCWLVGSSPSGEWTGKSGQIACWNGGGWYFITPTEGMRIRNAALSCYMVYHTAEWHTPDSIADVTGGNMIDVEARNILNLLLSSLRTSGFVRL